MKKKGNHIKIMSFSTANNQSFCNKVRLNASRLELGCNFINRNGIGH